MKIKNINIAIGITLFQFFSLGHASFTNIIQEDRSSSISQPTVTPQMAISAYCSNSKTLEVEGFTYNFTSTSQDVIMDLEYPSMNLVSFENIINQPLESLSISPSGRSTRIEETSTVFQYLVNSSIGSSDFNLKLKTFPTLKEIVLNSIAKNTNSKTEMDKIRSQLPIELVDSLNFVVKEYIKTKTVVLFKA